MANTILITANWHTGALSQQTISRQYDNNRYVVQFVGYPEASEGNELDYYLLVWMSSAPGERPDEIAPIQLASDQWYISNVFTQQTQQIKFQMCALNTEGTFEAHSPIFTGFVRNSLEHDGTTQDIDVSTLFDAYREYLNELIIRSGAVVIDSVPTQGSGNAVSSGGVYDEITSLKEDLNNVDNRVSVLEQGSSGLTDAVKLALLQLAEKVAYIDDDGQDYYGDLYDALYAVTAISLNTNSLSLVSIGSTSQLTATTVPTGGTVTWSSSDTSIATVNNGLVTAIGYGTATITATAGSASATCSVLVEQASVTSISAVYTQSDAVYTVDSLDILIPDLVVTANWNTGTQTTVNDSDYVLSGTLTTGTSTITVSYGGKTTTFNATVTTAPFTWRYKASSGTLFSESSNLSSVTIVTGASETLENGYLHLMSPDGYGQDKEPAVRYYLNPTTNTHAKIKSRVRFIEIPKANGASGFRIVISNGSSGIRAGVHTVNDKYYLTARQGSSDRNVMELNLDTWYVIEVEKDGSNSVVTVDGTEVFTSSTPSTSYTTENQIFNQSVGTYNYGDSIVDVDYIEYYNYDE